MLINLNVKKTLFVLKIRYINIRFYWLILEILESSNCLNLLKNCKANSLKNLFMLLLKNIVDLIKIQFEWKFWEINFWTISYIVKIIMGKFRVRIFWMYTDKCVINFIISSTPSISHLRKRESEKVPWLFGNFVPWFLAILLNHMWLSR